MSYEPNKFNRKVIKEYREVFDHWLQGGKVWVKYDSRGSEWQISDRPEWVTNHFYVRAGLFEHLYKAIAEGHMIQYKTENCDWLDYTNQFGHVVHMFSEGGVYQYRIKPKEDKFKVGDWIKHRPTGSVSFITKIDGHKIYNHEDIYGDIGHIDKWEPEEGEWCWFWQNGHKPFPILAKFVRMYNSYTYQCSVQALTGNAIYDNCEPFIGVLPTPYKDKECK